MTTSSAAEPTDRNDLRDAAAALAAQEFARVCELVCASLVRSPHDAEARQLLATAAVEMGVDSFVGDPSVRFLTAEAWFDLGLAFVNAEHLTLAAVAFERAVLNRADWADGWYNLGESQRRLGQTPEAIAALERTTQIDQSHLEAWYSLGNVRAASGDPTGALEAYDKLLDIDDHHANGFNNRGVVCRRLGWMVEAAGDFRRAIDINPTYASAFDNLGNTMSDLGEADAAVAAFEAAIRLVPDYHDAYYNLGNVHRDVGRADLAIECYARTLDLKPDHEDARTHLGILLQDLGRLSEAEAAFRPLLEIHEDQPQNHGNLANVLRDQGRYDEALTQFKVALSAGENARLLGNRALTLQHAGRLDEAIAGYKDALRLAPDDVILHNNLSHALLLAGRFDEGWREFEHRLNDPELAGLGAGVMAPRWAGESLDGKSILLFCEQGLGDAIQFVRFIENLRELGAEVILACPPRMARLFTVIPAVARIVDNLAPYPKCDYWSPLLSLPGLLGVTVQSFGEAVPYLAAEPELTTRWMSRLGLDTIFRVGLAWQGNTDYVGDHARSIPLRHLWPLTERTDVTFYSLQQSDGAMQLDTLNEDDRVAELGSFIDRTDGFIDTAAVLSVLDLLITSDTSLPHLAGALGRPVWMLLPYAPDWRWMLDRNDSPWYPSIRIVRQPEPWDWQGAVAQLGRALDGWRVSGGVPNDAFDNAN